MTARQQRRLWRHVRDHRELLGNARRVRARRRRAAGRDCGGAALGDHLPDQAPGDRRRHRAGADPALARIERLRAAERVRRAALARTHRRVARARHRDRRPPRKLPRRRRGVEVARDSRVARRSKRLPPATRRLGIGVVSTVSECLDILTAVDRTPDDRPGVVDRVMRLLGIKEPTQREPFQFPHLDAIQQPELSD